MPTVFQRVGPFEILEEIGRGGMAVVFLATDTRSGARIALKLVPTGSDREAREILEAEKWGAALQDRFSRACPGVPDVYEYDTDGPYFYIAMEYVEGENLSDVISRGALLPDRAVAITMELLRVIDLAHEFETTIEDRKLRSLIHGDLKPRNVRLTKDGRLKVLDFGIAKALSLSRKVTRNDFGSVAYLSPERLETGDVDAHADFWAAGVLLYEMLSGEQPFRAADTRRLEKRITSRQPPAPLTARCPVALQAILAKLLAPEPADRYGSAKAIREDLERFTAGQPTEAERQGWPSRIADEGPTRRTRPAADEGATRRTAHGAAKAPVVPPPIPVSASTPGVRMEPPPIPGTASKGTALRPPPRPRPRRRLLRAALLAAALFVVGNEACVATTAARLTEAARTDELDGLVETWREYHALAPRSRLGFGLLPLRRSLRRQTALLTDRVIGRYRAAGPTVWEPEWTLARQALAHAVAVSPESATLRGALRYCDGHIARINGEARKRRGQTAAAEEHFGLAVVAFREAAELRPDWPDPFLGLARTFISGQEDLERGADALEQAQQRGYAPGERETFQLADGFRARGRSLERTAGKLAGLPQEQEYLTRAADAYRQALTLFGKLAAIDASGPIRLSERGLRRVVVRLEALSQPMLQIVPPSSVRPPDLPQWH